MGGEREFERLRGEIEELFSDLWQVPRFAARRAGFRPAVDCFRTGDPAELTVLIDLAGVDPDDVKIVAVEQTLIVSGVRPRPYCEGRVYQQMEIEYGPFERRIPLVEEVDTAAAEATYERGLLRVVLPIAPRASGPVKVPIEVRRQR